jgi:hypothetical protein
VKEAKTKKTPPEKTRPEKKQGGEKKTAGAAEKTSGKRASILPAIARKAKAPPAEEVTSVQAQKDTAVLRFVVFIIEWKAARFLSEIFDEQNVRFHFICKARGTASSEILDLLGIGASDKAVVLALEQDVMVPMLLKEVAQGNPGPGIAFSLPLSGINKPILGVFKDSIHKHISDKKQKTEKDDIPQEGIMADKKHDLIVIVVNQGFSDELMAVARDAGATGGTIVNARGLVHKGPVKFFGISVQDEKEIITILATRDKKVAIMSAVSKGFGIASKAKGIVFSVPADNVTGLK